MSKVVTISNRGTLTLPKEMRRRLGILDTGQVVVEETSEGVLLRPGVTFPVEIYTAERLAEFAKQDKALEPHRAWIESAYARLARKRRKRRAK